MTARSERGYDIERGLNAEAGGTDVRRAAEVGCEGNVCGRRRSEIGMSGARREPYPDSIQ